MFFLPRFSVDSNAISTDPDKAAFVLNSCRRTAELWQQLAAEPRDTARFADCWRILC
jgi:hypothetical protein